MAKHLPKMVFDLQIIRECGTDQHDVIYEDVPTSTDKLKDVVEIVRAHANAEVQNGQNFVGFKLYATLKSLNENIISQSEGTETTTASV
jgi:argonaute-like protein implicated in RNA metabolism and viral defense